MPEPVQPKPTIWSFQLCKVSGIPIRIHITFSLFLVWIFLGNRVNAVSALVLVLTLFACVGLHELGHAFAARHYGIETDSITIYPIGGLAIIQGRPKPIQEFWIALAGPGVNFLIAGGLALGLVMKTGKFPSLILGQPNMSFIQILFVANLILAVFNLIPAIPMDGGRILRALISLKVEEPRATRYAVAVGQSLSIFLFFGGLLTKDLILSIVAALVFVAASQELAETTAESLLAHHKVSEAMQNELNTIPSGTTIENASLHLIHGSQHVFPVMVGSEVVGLLSHGQIVSALAMGKGTDYVAGHMQRNIIRVLPDDDLDEAAKKVQESPEPLAVVNAEGTLLGLLSKESLSEFIMLAHASAIHPSSHSDSALPH